MRILVVLLAATILCFGQEAGQFGFTSQNSAGAQNTKWCDPTGTWFGGNDMTTPYKLVVAPVGIGRYSINYQQGINYAAYGILGATDWTGEITLGRGQKYDGYSIAFFVLGPDQASQMGGSLDMDAVHSTIEFTNNCNVITSTIDTYIGYIPWTGAKVPFVTQPDWNYLEMIGVPTIVETYYRMPTTCKNCPFAGTTNSVLRSYGVESRGKRR